MTDIKIPWKDGDSVSDWTDKCASVLESFGLPGNKYVTEVTKDYMIFSFVEPEDALIARLIIGG